METQRTTPKKKRYRSPTSHLNCQEVQAKILEMLEIHGNLLDIEMRALLAEHGLYVVNKLAMVRFTGPLVKAKKMYIFIDDSQRVTYGLPMKFDKPFTNAIDWSIKYLLREDCEA